MDSHLLAVSGVSSCSQRNQAESNKTRGAHNAYNQEAKRTATPTPNAMQSHQRRSMNSYSYYYLNAACHRSSSSLSCPSSPSALPPIFEMYEASPSFESPPSRATRRNLRNKTPSPPT